MRITCYYRFKALFLHLHRPPKDTMHTLKLTTTATFRTFYRTATAALVVAILAMMFLTSQSSNATVTPDPTNNGCIGKNYTVEKYFAYPNNNIDAGELWISIDNNKTQTIEVLIENSQCGKVTYDPDIKTNRVSQIWVKFDRKFNFKKGINIVNILTQKDNPVIKGIGISADGKAPSNVNDLIKVYSDTSSCTVSNPVDCITDPPVTKQNPPITIDPCEAAQFREGCKNPPTTKHPVATSLPAQPPTTIEPATTKVTATSYVSNWSEPSTTIKTTSGAKTQPSNVVIPPTSPDVSVLGITAEQPADIADYSDQFTEDSVNNISDYSDQFTEDSVNDVSDYSDELVNYSGDSISENSASDIADESDSALPFTGSSTRTLLIWSLSAILLGLIVLGVQKRYLLAPTCR